MTGVEAVSLLGQQRLVARVELQGGRYPTPAWWAGELQLLCPAL